MSKPATIKIADLNALIEKHVSRLEMTVGSAEWWGKVAKAAQKADTSDERYLAAELAKKIKCGAIKIGKWSYPVVNGEIDYASGGYQHTSAAAQLAARYGNVKNEIEHITSL